jgi:predicted secreted protein
MVNSSGAEGCPAISDDGLELYFWSTRPGSSGTYDIFVSKRATKQDDWGQAVNLGTPVNSPSADLCSDISPDGLSLILVSARAGGYGGSLGDLWLTKRSRTNSPWGQPVNLGPIVNGSSSENGPCLSADGSMLYFSSDRAGGSGLMDMWQVPLIPIVDFDGDGFVDANDMSIMVVHWGEDYSLCDIAPCPFGDGIVDTEDLIVLAEHLFEVFPPVEPVEVDEADDGVQVELVLGQMLVVTLESNPTTGYCWELVEEQGAILKQMGKAEFIPSDTGEPPLVGAGGWEIFRFRAVSTGQMNLQLAYHRPWEGRVPPLQTFSLQAIVP